MKKTIPILCIIMMLACVLAGCSSSTNDNSEDSTLTGTVQDTESNRIWGAITHMTAPR